MLHTYCAVFKSYAQIINVSIETQLNTNNFELRKCIKLHWVGKAVVMLNVTKLLKKNQIYLYFFFVIITTD